MTAILLGRLVEVKLGRADSSHHRIKDQELTGRERADHHATRAEAGEAEAHKTHFARNRDETLDHRALAAGALLVDLGQQRVGRVRNDCRDDTGNDARAERDGGGGGALDVLGALAERRVHGLGGLALDGELGHGVRHLLEENRDNAVVEAEEALVLNDVHHAGGQRLREGRVADGANTRGLERAEENVRNDLGKGRRGEIDRGAVAPGLLLAERVGELDLEKLHTAKLEPALHKVAGCSGAETGGERTDTLGRGDLANAAKQRLVAARVELHASLHDINRANGRVSHRAAKATSQRAFEKKKKKNIVTWFVVALKKKKHNNKKMLQRQ